MDDIISKLWSVGLATLAGAIGWLVRRVFTNEKQIAILLESQKHRDGQIDEMRSDIKQLIRKVGE